MTLHGHMTADGTHKFGVPCLRVQVLKDCSQQTVLTELECRAYVCSKVNVGQGQASLEILAGCSPDWLRVSAKAVFMQD